MKAVFSSIDPDRDKELSVEFKEGGVELWINEIEDWQSSRCITIPLSEAAELLRYLTDKLQR
jgi:hypothetical protein